MTRSVLSGMCGLAARHDAMDRNPVRDAQAITQPRKAAPKSLTVTQVRQLRALMTYDDTEVERDLPEFVSFMLATGLRIGEVLAAPFTLGEERTSVEVRASIGIATGARASAEELLRDADIAMYQAKDAGRGRYVTFVPGSSQDLCQA